MDGESGESTDVTGVGRGESF